MKYYKIIDNKQVFFKGNVLYTEQGTIINPTEEQMLDAGWLPYTPPALTAEELLAQAKANKVAEIGAYDQSDAVNQFLLGGAPMWLDAPTRQQLRISIEAYQATGAETVTKWFGGQEFTFPTSAWLRMLNALEVYAAEALNVTEAHKSAVNALDSVDAVAGFDITAGYPDKLNFDAEWLRSHT